VELKTGSQKKEAGKKRALKKEEALLAKRLFG